MTERYDGEEPTERVLLDIQDERERQIAKGYDESHDTEHGIDHLVKWAAWYANQGHSTVHVSRTGQPTYTEERTDRSKLVQAAALLVAAVELIDRDPEL